MTDTPPAPRSVADELSLIARSLTNSAVELRAQGVPAQRLLAMGIAIGAVVRCAIEMQYVLSIENPNNRNGSPETEH